MDAEQSLLEAGHNFNTIIRISEQSWKNLNVPEGITSGGSKQCYSGVI